MQKSKALTIFNDWFCSRQGTNGWPLKSLILRRFRLRKVPRKDLNAPRTEKEIFTRFLLFFFKWWNWFASRLSRRLLGGFGSRYAISPLLPGAFFFLCGCFDRQPRVYYLGSQIIMECIFYILSDHCVFACGTFCTVGGKASLCDDCGWENHADYIFTFKKIIFY